MTGKENGAEVVSAAGADSDPAPGAAPSPPEPAPASRRNVTLDLGWGRLLFAQTFDSPAALVAALREEGPGRRDIAFYVQDPHVLLAEAPLELFLDPSHTFRLDLRGYADDGEAPCGFRVRPIETQGEAEAVNAIYAAREMNTAPPEFFFPGDVDAPRAVTVFVAEDAESGLILGAVTGVDHALAFGDPEKGSSLWSLAVLPQASRPRVGEMLSRHLARHYKAGGAAYLDLSVIHDNAGAIRLYEKLGFTRAPYFAVKRKNPFNESLFTGPDPADELNPYARIIVDEARRRGIDAQVIDAPSGLMTLSFGGRSVRCRESLSEFTSAVAMTICDDKAITRRVVERAGIVLPEQISADDDPETIQAFLTRHGSLVVKPARGEQGRGVAVGLSDRAELAAAIAAARRVCPEVLIEQEFKGQDLRLVVIDYKVVAAALRKPPQVTGDGASSIRTLIETLSRRRRSATGGESSVPIDAETERCVAAAGRQLDDVLPIGASLEVRRTANLHTGGEIYDVTAETHPVLIRAAVEAARAIDIPVTGIDLMVKSPLTPEYVFIEANERPGLANHEPQPTAERFIDLLFPLSMPASARKARFEKLQGG